MADLRVIYGPATVWATTGQTRATLPAGVGRVFYAEDLNQEPVWVNFGASNVTANPGQGFRIDYGRSEYIIPDDATTVALHSNDGHTIVAKIGWAEKPAALVEEVPAP